MKNLKRMGYTGLIWFWAVAAQAEVVPLENTKNSVLGSIYTIQSRYGETIPALAKAHEVGYHELLWANQEVHSWMPGEGAEIRIPRQYVLPGPRREGIVLNLPEMRLYYYEASGSVRTYPISIGRMDWTTPVGLSEVVTLLKDPAWYPPESIRKEHEERDDPLPRIVPPGPDNPMGEYALQLSVPGYFIHGTNRDEGIGMRVTHGCVRMRSQDIEDLAFRVAKGTSVEITAIPVKVGTLDGVVYMEAHPTLREEIPMPEKNPALDETEVGTPLAALEEQLPPGDYVIFWEEVMKVAREAQGMPMPVGWAVDSDGVSEVWPSRGRTASGESSLETTLHIPDRSRN